MNPIAALFNIIPGWIWAILFAGATATACVETHQKTLAQLDTQTLKTAIGAQKLEASRLLTKMTERADAATLELATAKATQETKDAQAAQTVETLKSQLAAAAGPAGRLRDPNAPGCGSSGGSPEGQTPGNPQGGPGDAPQAGGLLSAELTGLLSKLTFEADDINEAYISCRADSLQVRASDTP